MSQIISKLTYQVNLPKSLEIEDYYYSPIFSTNNNMFWQLLLQLEDNEDNDSYGLFLQPVAGPDEVTWRERSKLSFKIFIKEIRNNNKTAELYNKSFVVPPDTPIGYDFGYHNVIKKSSLRNGELIIGVIVNNIEYNESDIRKTYYPEPIPKNLIEAWKEQLFDFRSVDVEFDAQGEKFYACSSILSKRSEYFAKILSGHWSESTFLGQNEPSINCDIKFINKSNYPNINIVGKNDDNDDNSICQIKHRIKISEYDPIAISAMLEYLYTNQIKWTNKDNDSITTELFRLADQYLLSDLRERAKTRILEELKISNVSKIMFDLVPKYGDLKEPVLNYMAKNFEQVNNSQEFKDILANLVDYPNYNVILSEILTEHFKIQKAYSF
ncbi:hypothetical protein RhiirC2_860976 [Rhizophagus irregularis]|uniref:BTB domain-containing protein n=1 Tax=Rhizophagus irregularis TaxID=588596 RepID=A0A2N1NYB0_9GLOM|nr:hypothetical protein RhiirC2_851366 [Rhizophagus irregularis]PKK78835.1 hypothetical protein RhiirC2_860976 [Rhizophagus irregularis]